MKLYLGIPTSETVSYLFVSAYTVMLAKALRKYPDLIFEQFFVNGVRTDKNRNDIVKKFLEDPEGDAVLFLDTDMIYPGDMILKYLAADKDLIGGIYYKRSDPHYPIAYKFSDNKDKPFYTIDPLIYPGDTILELDGVGTGGMFVKRVVFERMKKSGEDPWFKYGDNYHLPYEAPNQTTHDLMFCKKARETGTSIYLHTGVKMLHITPKKVGDDDWIKSREQEERMKDKHVEILMPVFGSDAEDTLMGTLVSLVQETMYKDYKVRVIVDGDEKLEGILKKQKIPAEFEGKVFFEYEKENIGFPNRINQALAGSEANYFVYIGQDVIFGLGWLEEALRVHSEAFPDGDGLVAFNDGKWRGKNASHGLVHRNFLKYTGKTLFFSGYRHYRCDVELSQVAIRHQKLAYAYDSVVYHMQAKVGRKKKDESYEAARQFKAKDDKLYKEREKMGFPLH